MTLFPIMLEVEESAVGSILRKLKDMPGIAGLHLDLDNVAKKGVAKMRPSNPKEAKKSQAERGPRAKDILITELISGPKTRDQLRQALVNHKFNPSSMDPLVRDLKAKQIVENTSAGIYQLTAAALAQLDKSKPSQLPAPAHDGVEVKRQPPGAGIAFVINAIRAKAIDGIVTRQVLVDLGTANGMTERAVDGTLTRMKQAKLISAPEPAHYKLTARAVKKFPLEESPQANQEG